MNDDKLIEEWRDSQLNDYLQGDSKDTQKEYPLLINANFSILCSDAKISSGLTKNEICISIRDGYVLQGDILHLLETIESKYLIEILNNRDEI